MRITDNLACHADNLACHCAYYRGQSDVDLTRGTSIRASRVRIANKFTRVGFACVAGDQPMKHPAFRNPDSILEKIRVFHGMHETPMERTLADLTNAVEQLPGHTRGHEAKVLADVLQNKVSRKRMYYLYGENVIIDVREDPHMGYANLFAVPIGELRSAIGSLDQHLIDRLHPHKAGKGGIAPEAGPRVKLCKNGEIYFNGVLVTWDDFIRQLGDPLWDGTELYEYTESFELDGDWHNSGEFWSAVRAEMASWQGRGPRFTAWNLCSSEEKLMQAGKDELTDAQAALELVRGTISKCGKSSEGRRERLRNRLVFLLTA